MHRFRRHLRACTWLALVAMFAVALGPTVSRLRLPAVDAPTLASAAAIAAPSHDHAAMLRAATVHAAVDHAAMHHARMHAVEMQPALHAAHAHGPLPSGAPAAPTPPSPHEHGLDHCGLCALATWAFAVAPPAPRVESVATVRWRLVVALEPGLAPAHVTWPAARPRGPPAAA